MKKSEKEHTLKKMKDLSHKLLSDFSICKIKELLILLDSKKLFKKLDVDLMKRKQRPYLKNMQMKIDTAVLLLLQMLLKNQSCTTQT